MRFGAYPRQNGLALALREIGRIERALFRVKPATRLHVLFASTRSRRDFPCVRRRIGGPVGPGLFRTTAGRVASVRGLAAG